MQLGPDLHLVQTLRPWGGWLSPFAAPRHLLCHEQCHTCPEHESLTHLPHSHANIFHVWRALSQLCSHSLNYPSWSAAFLIFPSSLPTLGGLWTNGWVPDFAPWRCRVSHSRALHSNSVDQKALVSHTDKPTALLWPKAASCPAPKQEKPELYLAASLKPPAWRFHPKAQGSPYFLAVSSGFCKDIMNSMS